MVPEKVKGAAVQEGGESALSGSGERSKAFHLADRVFQFLASLKLAVVVLTALTLCLIVATFLESLYDTPTAKYWVYNTTAFRLLLAFLGANIFVVAVSRWPWKRKHGPFLLAHAGILILLAGSLVTDRFGLDGSLRISEGEINNIVELDQLQLLVRGATTSPAASAEGQSYQRTPVAWIPPHVTFKPYQLEIGRSDLAVTVENFLPHAEPQYDFLPTASEPSGKAGGLGDLPEERMPALKLKVQGGPMRITQEYWLWKGEPSWSRIQAGPAVLTLLSSTEEQAVLEMRGRGKAGPGPAANAGPHFRVLGDASGGISYEAISSEGKKVAGKLAASQIQGFRLEPGWKGGVTLTFEKWVPHATPLVTYRPARIQYGQQAPPSALHLVAAPLSQVLEAQRSGKKLQAPEVWLGLGERATLNFGGGSGEGKSLELAYFPQRVVLPFSVKLNRFSIERYEGTVDPSSFASQVTILNQGKSLEADIRMNEPHTSEGVTLFQASYEEGQPRPVTSIFTVNQDPGRSLKYLGSLLLVLGSVWLFAMKSKKKAKTVAPSAA